jgi:uncharacterized protein (DUF1684 family)
MSDGTTDHLQRAGTVRFSVDGTDATLLAFHQGDELFIPFRDATSGTTRTARAAMSKRRQLGKGRYLLDFNRAYNPYCAYNDDWRCPLPPAENWLKVADPRRREALPLAAVRLPDISAPRDGSETA